MAQLVLKQEIVDAIKRDTILYGKVAASMGVGIRGLYKILSENSVRLTTATVLLVIREHMKIKKDSELLEEVAASAA